MPKKFFLLPGPALPPPELSQIMGQPSVWQAEDEFSELLYEVNNKCKRLLQTKDDVFFLNCSGTGAMEGAISSTLSRDDKIVAMVGGNYGERFARISESYHLEVLRINSPWGESLDLEQLEKTLARDKKKEIKAILVTHNEGSTGVLNNIKKISWIRGDHPALIIVDAVGSVGGIELKKDEWDLDVVITSTQNALSLPPGLSMISFSERAWEARELSDLPKFYFDMKSYHEAFESGQTPYSPDVSLIKALNKSLEMIFEEGIENRYSRHMKLMKMVREGIKAMNLEPMVLDDIASPVVTTVKGPRGVEVDDIRQYLKDNFNVYIAGGQKMLSGKIMRIAHVGDILETDIIVFLSALEVTLNKLGYMVEPGKGVARAEEILLETDV